MYIRDHVYICLKIYFSTNNYFPKIFAYQKKKEPKKAGKSRFVFIEHDMDLIDITRFTDRTFKNVLECSWG